MSNKNDGRCTLLYAQGYRHDAGITPVFARIIADEKQHVRMIQRRLVRWQQENPAIERVVAQTEVRIQTLYEQSWTIYDRNP